VTAPAPAEDPQVAPTDRARIARRATLGLAIPAAVAASVVAGLFAAGHRGPALGVTLGAGAALLITASWVVGALATFHRSGAALLGFTVGLWPVRIALIVLTAAAGMILAAEPISLVLSMVVTHVWGHVVEATTLDALAQAGRAAAKPPDPPSG
jgi:hypothetical protein